MENGLPVGELAGWPSGMAIGMGVGSFEQGGPNGSLGLPVGFRRLGSSEAMGDAALAVFVGEA